MISKYEFQFSVGFHTVTKLAMMSKDADAILKKVKYFEIESKKYTEFFIWPLSGGVASFIPVPNFNKKILEFIYFLDKIIVSMSKDIFPLQLQIVLSNTKK